MYSYEDRLRAVHLYLKLGKRIGATLRALGYPTKNALKAWHREYEQGHDLPTGYARSRPKYSAAQKQAAVDHYLNHGCCAAATLRALGYPGRATLVAWIEEQCPHIGKRPVGRVAGCAPRPQSVKQAAVIALCTREESASLVAQKAGVSRPMLYNWKNQLLGREAPASMKRQKTPAPYPERTALEQQVESLRRSIRQLELERDILRKANELIKKETGVTLQCLGNREKAILVDALKQTYTLPELLAASGLARSSYFYHRARQWLPDKYAAVRDAMTSIFHGNYRSYGYRRMHAVLRQGHARLSEKVVRRLMQEEQLVVHRTRRRGYSSYCGEIGQAPENLLARQFHARSP